MAFKIENGVLKKYTEKQGVTEIVIPDSVTGIGKSAFSRCSNLTEIKISDSVTSIGDCVFWCCISLTKITIPDNVKHIGDCVFYGCSSLTAIEVSENNENYTSIDGVLYNKDVTELIYCPCAKREVIIPDSVTSIGKSAFASCSNLKEIKIPNSVKSIGNYAFSGCTSLESVELSNNVKELYGTFENCNNLKSVTIPESVIYIDNAFYDCRNLKSLIIPESVEAFSFDFGYCADEFSLTILSDNLYIRSLHDSGYYDMEFLFDSIHEGRMKIYAHENSTVYNVYKYACYNNYRDNQEEYEKALSKFNIIKNDTDINDDTQWYTVVKSADVNNDGKIDASDASDILNYYAYISTGGELSFEDFTALKE